VAISSAKCKKFAREMTPFSAASVVFRRTLCVGVAWTDIEVRHPAGVSRPHCVLHVLATGQ
jgi:hypothetical protein